VQQRAPSTPGVLHRGNRRPDPSGRGAGWWIALAVLFLAICPGVLGRPELESAFLTFGRSRAVAASTWGTLSYRLRNPDSTPATVRLRLVPRDGATAIFEFDATVGPHRFLAGREMVTLAPSDKYRLEVYQGQTRLDSSEILASYSDPLNRCAILFIDDDPTFGGVSELVKTRGLLQRVVQTKVPSAQAPTHWAGYDDCRIVALGSPDYAALDSDRCAALVEYVHRGGTLVFLLPDGALAARGTPLADLMPAVPLRVRLVEDLPELDAWGAATGLADRQPFASPDGIPFLESVPQGEGMTTLGHGDYPVIRWRAVGLGRVGLVAVNPCTELAQRSGCFLAVWNHLLSWAQSPYSFSYRENNREVPDLMAHLTGYRIPGVAPVARLLFGYAGVIGILLIVGYTRRRHATVWIAAAGIGVLATALVFVAAYRQNQDRPRRGATVLAFATDSGERSAVQAAISLHSRGDSRPTIAGTNPDLLLRNLPAVTRGMRKQSGEAPVLVHRAHDLSAAPNLDVRALKPRSFAAVGTLAPQEAPTIPLVLGANGPDIAPTALPGWLPRTSLQAFAVLPNGLLRVRLDGGQAKSLAALNQSLRLDPFQTQLAELLASGRFPSPSLAVVYPWSPGQLPLDLKDFAQQGYAIHFLPMRTELAAGQIAVPAECVRVLPHDGYTRSSLENQEFSVVRHPQQYLDFDAVLPPWLQGFQPTEIEVTLATINPGGNLATELRLALPEPPSTAPERGNAANNDHPLWRAACVPEPVAAETYRFTSVPPGLFSPTTGRGRLLVRISQKTFVRDATIAERTNSWRFGEVRVRLVGQLPEQREF